MFGKTHRKVPLVFCKTKQLTIKRNFESDVSSKRSKNRLKTFK